MAKVVALLVLLAVVPEQANAQYCNLKDIPEVCYSTGVCSPDGTCPNGACSNKGAVFGTACRTWSCWQESAAACSDQCIWRCSTTPWTATPAPTLDCGTPTKIVGKWQGFAESSGNQALSITTGVDHHYSGSNSKGWGAGAASGMSIGFSFAGISIGAGSSSGNSNDLSKMFSGAFGSSKSTTSTFDFPAGYIWQWQIDVTDSCGMSTVKTKQFAITPNLGAGPCCLPGYFEDPTIPNGACAPGSARDAQMCPPAAMKTNASTAASIVI